MRGQGRERGLRVRTLGPNFPSLLITCLFAVSPGCSVAINLMVKVEEPQLNIALHLQNFKEGWSRLRAINWVETIITVFKGILLDSK